MSTRVSRTNRLSRPQITTARHTRTRHMAALPWAIRMANWFSHLGRAFEMRGFLKSVVVIVVALAFVAPASAWGQLPTATGRQFTLSDPNWKLFIPSTYQHRPNDTVDLLVNFKGDPQIIWDNAAYAKLNVAIVTIHYGNDVL